MIHWLLQHIDLFSWGIPVLGWGFNLHHFLSHRSAPRHSIFSGVHVTAHSTRPRSIFSGVHATGHASIGHPISSGRRPVGHVGSAQRVFANPIRFGALGPSPASLAQGVLGQGIQAQRAFALALNANSSPKVISALFTAAAHDPSLLHEPGGIKHFLEQAKRYGAASPQAIAAAVRGGKPQDYGAAARASNAAVSALTKQLVSLQSKAGPTNFGSPSGTPPNPLMLAKAPLGHPVRFGGILVTGLPKGFGGNQAGPRLTGQKTIFQAAAKKYGINPALLWGVYGTETGFGSNTSTSSAGAQGFMQFEPGTARTYHVNPYNLKSAVFGAAHLLKDAGINKNVGKALSAYNAGPAGGYQAGYVSQVLQHAKSWPSAKNLPVPSGGGGGMTIGGAVSSAGSAPAVRFGASSSSSSGGAGAPTGATGAGAPTGLAPADRQALITSFLSKVPQATSTDPIKQIQQSGQGLAGIINLASQLQGGGGGFPGSVSVPVPKIKVKPVRLPRVKLSGR